MPWPLPKKIAFRFLFTYLILYCIQLPPTWLWNNLVPHLAKLLGLTVFGSMNGSGDTTFHYVQVLCFLLIAATVTLIWSIADRDTSDYHRLYLGLRVLVRITLGGTLISYGAAKIIQTQFPPPQLHRLLQPVGEMSPMGLLWTFMGASTPYNLFTGASEMLAGVLLFFPTTTLLGSLVAIAVMTQVVALNFCYDVPVKLFSSHLLAGSIFLAAPDARRLANLLLLNRDASPAPRQTVLQRPIHLRAAFALKLAFLLVITGVSLFGAWKHHQQFNRPTLFPYGIWETQSFVLNGKEEQRWKRLIFERDVNHVFTLADGRYLPVMTIDRAARTVTYEEHQLPFTQPDPESILIQGATTKGNLQIRLRRVDQKIFLLTNRGFHWINESPFNR